MRNIYLREGDTLTREFTLKDMGIDYTADTLPSDAVFVFGIKYTEEEGYYVISDTSYADGVLTVFFEEAVSVGYVGEFNYGIRVTSNSASYARTALAKITIDESFMVTGDHVPINNAYIDLDALLERIGVVEDDLADAEINIATNASDIAQNTSDISDNADAIAQNTSDISDNATAIANKTHTSLLGLNDDTDNQHISTAQESNLDNINVLTSISDVSNTYTLNLNSIKNKNFAISIGDTTAKTIAFSNIPSGFVQFTCKVDFDNVADITYPTSVVWQDDLEPIMEEDKIYWLLFVTSDGGTTVYGSYIGGF